MRDFVEAACADLPHADRQRLVLIVEELFCNSVDHGYGGDSDQPVWLTVAPHPDGCQLIYADAAPAYDPFAVTRDPQLAAAVEERPVGGLGVYLIGEMCTSKKYARSDDCNVIELFVAHGRPGPAATP